MPSEELMRLMAAKPRFTMSDLKLEVTQLTLDHLKFAVFIFIADKLNRGEALNEPMAIYFLSHQVLRFYLGDNWVESNVFNKTPGKAKWNQQSRAFLLSDSSDTADNFRHQHRVIELAESLYNLQHLPGIDHRIEEMQKANLLSAFAELQCARIMASPQSKLRFIKPDNEHKKRCPDAELTTPSGRTLFCEIKAKDDFTDLDENAIKSSIEIARRQLPKNGPGIIWLAIPEKWSAQPGAKALVDKAITDKLYRTGRVVAVLVAFELWEPHGTGWLMEYRYTAAVNPKSRFYQDDILATFEEFGSYSRPEWHRLDDLVTSIYQTCVDFVRERLASETQPPDQPQT